MAISDYTSYDDVRAALGVSIDELEDDTLSLPLYEYSLTAELDAVSVDLTTVYANLVLLSPVTSTTSQKRVIEATYLFATYAVAKHLSVSLPLFSPKEISDGKAMQSRYTQDPYKATIALVDSQYTKFKQRLDTLFSAYNVSATTVQATRAYMTVVSPSFDPVTG